LINKIIKYFYRADIHTKEVLSKSASSLLVRLSGMIANFLLSIIIARSLGAQGVGVFALNDQIISICLIITMLGINNTLIREVAIYFDKKNSAGILNIIQTALRIIIPFSIVISIFAFIISSWLSNTLFNSFNLKQLISISLIAVPFQSISRIYASGLNGIRKIWQSNFVTESSSLILTLAILGLIRIFKLPLSIINIAISFLLSRIIVSMTVYLYWKSSFNFKDSPKFIPKFLLTASIPLLLYTATTKISSSIDTIMLGIFTDAQEVGIYNIASRIAILTSLFNTITISAISPKIALLYDRNLLGDIQIMIQKITTILILIGLISLITFITLGKYILKIWGDEFQSVYPILLILTVGQMFNVGTGATGAILMMTRKEKLISKITLISLIINIILNLLLIPTFGAKGAAYATAITVITYNIVKVILVNKIVGISTLPVKLFNKFSSKNDRDKNLR